MTEPKKTSPAAVENKPRREGAHLAGLALGLAVFAILVFRVVLPAETVLFTTDDNIGSLAYRKAELPGAYVARWTDNVLLGRSSLIPVQWTSLLLWLLPLEFYTDWIHAIDLWIASIFLVAFLRLRGVGWTGCLLAALTAYWTGTNLTLTYAGHLGKFGAMMFGAVALWMIEKCAQTRHYAWGVLAGGAVGMMLLEQQDVGLFLGLLLGAYAVYALVRAVGWKPLPLVLSLAPMGVAVLLTAGPSVFRAYETNVSGSDIMSEKTDPRERWDFCTQWSVPPDESVDFIAPGFTGWRSYDPEGPYWGRTGRAADWEKTRQGFPNFRLESIYVGIIPVALALCAVFLALRGDFKGVVRADTLFWSAAAVLALLLSFGRYFPLYKLFYLLPGMDSIRNPNKFLHVFQIALAVVTAFGAQALLPVQGAEAGLRNRRLRWFAVALLGVACLLLLSAASVGLSRGYWEQKFAADGWRTEGAVMAGNMVRALVHAGLLGVLCAGGLLVALWRPWEHRALPRQALGWALALVVALDALALAGRYITPMELRGNVEGNAAVRFLKKNLGQQRLYMLDQSGFYNNWLTVLFPYHDISTFNLALSARLETDYDRFLKKVGADPLRLWELSGVGYILAPGRAWQGIRRDPRLKRELEVAFRYDVYPLGAGIGVAESVEEGPDQHLVLRYKRGLPRFLLVDQWEGVGDDKVCEALLRPDFNPRARVLVTPPDATLLPAGAPAAADRGPAGDVKVLFFGKTEQVLSASVRQPSVLLAVQKFSPDWQVLVDGIPSRLLRCNYVCQGVYLTPGDHTVILRYRPGVWHLWVQASAALLCIGCVLQLAALRWVRKKGKE